MVIGASGSGKTTFARLVAARLSLPFYPTDPLYWDEAWRPVGQDKIEAWIDDLIAKTAWVIDGNFDNQRARLWPQADMIVWLDPPRNVTFWRIVARNMSWWVGAASVWEGRPMTLAKAMSGIRHSMTSVALKRRTYPIWLTANAIGPVVVLRSANEKRRWLRSLPLCD